MKFLHTMKQIQSVAEHILIALKLFHTVFDISFFDLLSKLILQVFDELVSK